MRSMKIESTYTKNCLYVLLLLIPVVSHSEPIDSKLNLQVGEFVHFLKINDMVYRLEWGKSGIDNSSDMTFDSSDIINCKMVAESDKFIVLKIDSDTGTGESIILPLNMKSPEIRYKNAICIDLTSKTIILEHPSQDTILIVENFINKKKMILGYTIIPCQTGFAHDCLDSLIYYKNKLSFKWITPHKRSVEKKIELKKFKINLK